MIADGETALEALIAAWKGERAALDAASARLEQLAQAAAEG